MSRKLFSLPAADEAVAGRLKKPDHGAVRHRAVGIDLDALTDGEPLDVSLFDGRMVTLDLDSSERRGRDLTWRGRVKGHPDSHATISVVDGNVAGTIDFGPHDRYQVMSQADGSTLLRQIEESAFPPDHPPGPLRRKP